ncbi:hypothetical protein ACFXOD_35555 [Streptomyces sp. NPDC059161]|uniref:hypothetical protein n=1 Tax=Streptomyces sp. NPDC059161 TaxID=3346749 RepID=UPI0036746983
MPHIVVAYAGATADDQVSIDAEAVQLDIEAAPAGGKTMDRKLKPMLYAEADIPHCWRLEFDPAPRPVVSDLNSSRYTEKPSRSPGWSPLSRTRSPSRSTPQASPASNTPHPHGGCAAG